MIFQLRTLGTASAMPVSDRNPSAQVLSVHGRLFLIDCGEGTQQQLRRNHLSIVKIEAIFISHTHGDHIFGLPGLLNTMTMLGRTGRLDIYGPAALGAFIDFCRENFGAGGGFELVFHALEGMDLRLIHTSKKVTVSSFPLDHKVPTWGFRFDEIVTERHRLENPEYVGKSYAYCSDTRSFPQIPEFVRGVDALYHEATYCEDMADKAQEYFHSTAAQAARCALEAGAGRLIIGHYSSRVKGTEPFLNESCAIFPATSAANDGDLFEF